MTTPPTLTHVLHLQISVAGGIDVGPTPGGFRRVVPITGGIVSGPLFTGKVLPGGADHQLIRSDDATVVRAEYTLESDRGEIVLVDNVGIRTGTTEDLARLRLDQSVDADRIYFRSTPTFETAASRLRVLNDRVFIGSGTRLPGLVHFDVFEVQ